MKRKLTSQEMNIAMKQLENKKQEKEWIEYNLDYNDLMLKKGLEMNYKKNIRDFKQQKHEHESDLEMVNNVIKVLISQIRDGVEIKEIKEKKREDKKIKGGRE